MDVDLRWPESEFDRPLEVGSLVEEPVRRSQSSSDARTRIRVRSRVEGRARPSSVLGSSVTEMIDELRSEIAELRDAVEELRRRAGD